MNIAGNIADWNLAKIVEKWAAINPDKVALICDGTAYSFHELNTRSNDISACLDLSKVSAGDRVALLGRSGIDAVSSFFATAKLGAIYVPLNTRLTRCELIYQLRNSGSKVLLIDSDFVDVLKPRSADLENLDLTIIVYGSTSNAPDLVHQHLDELIGSLDRRDERFSIMLDLNAPLSILYTSGTTGSPKGAVTTHLQTFFKSFQVTNYLDLREDDIVMSQMPLFHSGALFGLMVPALSRGATYVTTGKFEATDFLADLTNFRPSIICCTTTMLRFILDEIKPEHHDFSCVRVLFGGGERTPMSLLEQVKNLTGLDVRMGYGQTENSFMCIQAKDEVFSHYGSVGRAGLFTDVWIADDSGAIAPAGQTGEICARGPTVMSGYWGMSTATTAAIHSSALHTGDIGFSDESSRLYLVDRKKDMYRSGAENVYPAEVEKHLMDHPDIFNAAVIGVEDEKWGEAGKAFIVPRQGISLSVEAILTFLQGRVARYKLPRHFEFVKELPLTSSGKVKKYELKNSLD